MLAHGRYRRHAVFRQQGVGHAVGKIAIRFMMQLDELKGQVWLQQVDHPASTAVTRVHHDFKGFEACHVHIGQQVLDIGLGGIQWYAVAPAAAPE